MALIVISWTWLYLSYGDSPWKRRPRNRSFIRPLMSSEVGSGGVMLRIGLTKWHIATIAFPNSS